MHYSTPLKMADELRTSKKLNARGTFTIMRHPNATRHRITSDAAGHIYEISYRGSVDRAVVVEASNLIDAAKDHFIGKVFEPAKQLPCFRLPYPEMLIEYDGRYIEDASKELEKSRPEWKGMPARPKRLACVIRSMKRGEGIMGRLQAEYQGRDHDTVECCLFVQTADGLYGPTATCVMSVDDAGVILSYGIYDLGDRRTFNVKGSIEVNGMASVDCNRMTNPRLQEGYLAMMLPALYAVQFMNCKNVTADTKEPPTTINERYTRQHKKPMVTYKVLRLDRTAQKAHSGTNEPHGNHNRYHFCRGHFKHYTADKPLLGRAVGVYWWESHARGSKKLGEVIKDYAVGVNHEANTATTPQGLANAAEHGQG